MERQPLTPRQRARLLDELGEIGLDWSGGEPWHDLAVLALDYARRPEVFERRVPSYGAIIQPTTDPTAWAEGSGLAIDLRPTHAPWMKTARLFADGLSSWVVLDTDSEPATAVFNRPAGSERDLVVLAEAMGATLIQRHPNGMVRVVGADGVHRWDGLSWHHEPPVATWIEAMVAMCSAQDHGPVMETLVAFALHDLGARNIGATLIYRPDAELPAGIEVRLPTPPPLQITRPFDLAPLRHALAQVDGATVFDSDGVLRHIGVRLVPTATAEAEVDGLRGMRHTSARRYSHDDPAATVIVVSESGTVTIIRAGYVVGISPTGEDADACAE